MAEVAARMPGPDRLPFLDVLRGVAALAVVFEHGFAVSIPDYLDFSLAWFDMGQWGVTLFLLISGFIIPVTLERGGSNLRFWINRFFRLFPLYWATIAFYALFYLLCRPAETYPPMAWQWLANLSMLQELVRAPHVTPVFWTLTLELMFYASCSLLYAIGLMRWTGFVVWIGQAALLLLGVAYPLIFDRRFPGGYVFMFLTMYVGTLFYRCTTGQVSRKLLGASLTSLAIVAVAVSYVCFAVFIRPTYPLTFHCVCAVWLAAYGCFAIGLYWRAQPMPSWLCYLGRISYSIYLVHTCLVRVMPESWPAPLYLTVLVSGTLVAGSFTYYAIEKPCMMLGRSVLARLLPVTPPSSHQPSHRHEESRAA
jgi:peptidoglycan/LPS O-acetylase OafA/YrhL